MYICEGQRLRTALVGMYVWEGMYGWELHVVRYDQALNNHGVPEQALLWPKL